MSKKYDNKKNIVIVGAGGGGSVVARELSAKLDGTKYSIILINPRPYRILLPSTVRLAVSDIDNLKNLALAPLDKLFHNNNGTFIQGKVKSIHEGGSGNYVTLEDGQTVPYHILVLSPGAIWEGPLAYPERESEMTSFLQNQWNQVKKAQDIVLVGGGAVGIEFAGEIKDIGPTKNVTIIQADCMLLNEAYPKKFRVAMEKRVRARGVNIISSDFIDVPKPVNGFVKTRNGKSIKADLVLATRGPRPNTAFINTLDSSALSSKGFVKVQPTFQVQGHPTVYAIGDAADLKEQKQVAKAQAHAGIVVANILATIDGKPLKLYKGSTEMIVITFGKAGGAAYFDVLWGIVLGDWFARMVKSKTLLIDMQSKSVGL